MLTGEIIQALQGLSEDDLKKIIMEANRIMAIKQAAPVSESEDGAATDDEYTPFWEPPHSLLSPEDEHNVRRIWKSPGGC